MMTVDDTTEFTRQVYDFYERCVNENENYYQLFGIDINATHKQTVTAYNELLDIFSREKYESMTNPEDKQKAVFILQRIDHVYTILTDPDKRAEYDKKMIRLSEPRVEKGPDPTEEAKSNFKLGKSLYDQKAYPMAMSAFSEALRLDPAKAVYYRYMGLCQLRITNARREAERSFQKAIDMEPWNSDHYASMGLLFLNERLGKRAEYYFREALKLNPENEMAIKGLSQVAPEETGGFQETARNVLKKVLPSIFDRK